MIDLADNHQLPSGQAVLLEPENVSPSQLTRKDLEPNNDRMTNQPAAREIYKIYLTDELPLAESRTDLVEAVVDAHYGKSDSNRFLDITYRSGRHDYLYRGDLASGAIIAAIVERAKEFAIKRSIEKRDESPITKQDLLDALQREYRENDLFPPSDITEDWLKLTDFEPGNVVRLAPYRQSDRPAEGSSTI